MHRSLRQVNDYWRMNKAEVDVAVADVARSRGAASIRITDAELGQNLLAGADQVLSDNFDPVYGGFGGEPKFPHVDALQYALERYYRTGDQVLGRILSRTLDAMQEGAIFDRVSGGFFRYATRRDWSAPHYEKMLEDNAGLLRLYCEAKKVFGDDRYGDTARLVGKYLFSALYEAADGVFYGSQDADEDFYRLDQAARGHRAAPLVDRTIYVDWNAQAASAYAAAYRVVGDPAMRHTALRAVDFLWSACYDHHRGLAHYFDDAARYPGLLADYASMLVALLDAHEVSGNPSYLDNAEALAQRVTTLFASSNKGFEDIPRRRGDRIGLLKVPLRPLSENGRAAAGLRRLALMTGKAAYQASGRQALESLAGTIELDDLSAGNYWRSVADFLYPATHVVIVGDRRDARTADLLWEATRVFAPGKVVQLVTPESPRLAALGYGQAPSPVAYVCQGTGCLAPIFSANDIAAALMRGTGS